VEVPEATMALDREVGVNPNSQETFPVSGAQGRHDGIFLHEFASNSLL
jgi:hypothetical protein